MLPEHCVPPAWNTLPITGGKVKRSGTKDARERGERARLKEDEYCRVAASENGKKKKKSGNKKVMVEQVKRERLFSAAVCTFSTSEWR